jgi:biopolymer transport protein TolR
MAFKLNRSSKEPISEINVTPFVDVMPLTLSINSKGEIFIQESKVEFDKIIAKVLAVSKNRTDTRIYVRGDKTINYGRVLEIMGLLSGSGFTKVALISEPYKER